ncbi:MAG: hypothetical protein ACYDHH_32775, partial [Solirubrobacteraceae bacterium]
DAIGAVAATWSLVRGVADALFALALLAIGVAVMTRGGSDARYSAKVLVPRLVLAAVLANASLVLCGGLIRLNNAIVGALVAVDPNADVFGQLAATVTGGGRASAPLLAALLGLAAAAMALMLAVLYLARDLGLVLAIVLAPLALAAAALPAGQELARLWARLFAALLFVQAVQAALVAVGLQLLGRLEWLGSDAAAFGSGLLLVTLLYVLLQLPLAACRWALQQPAALLAPTRLLVGAARRSLAA